jgi:hypothetical protein
MSTRTLASSSALAATLQFSAEALRDPKLPPLHETEASPVKASIAACFVHFSRRLHEETVMVHQEPDPHHHQHQQQVHGLSSVERGLILIASG